MPIIDFKKELLDLEDNPITQNKFGKPNENGNVKYEGQETITLGLIALSSLLNLSEKDKSLSGKERFERYQLSVKIQKSMTDNEPLEMVSEEITLIKEQIGDKNEPLKVGPAWDLLENKKEDIEVN